MRKTVSAVLAAFIMLTALLPVLTVPAAADDLPTFSLAVDKTEVHPKQTITVSVNVKNLNSCTEGVGSIAAMLIYNSDYLTITKNDIKVHNAISNTENVILNKFLRDQKDKEYPKDQVEIWAVASPQSPIPQMISNVFTCTFTVNEDVPEGTQLSFKLGSPDKFVVDKFDSSVVEGQVTLDVNVPQDTTTVTVGKMLSEDATLKSLSVDGYELNREFTANQTSYAIAVPYEVKSVSVNYQTASEFASAKLSGNTKLAVGTNAVKIAVTAEDGVTKKTYSITVTRQPAPEEESSVVSEPSDVSEPSSDVSDPSETESSQTPSEPESSEPISEPTSSRDERDDSYVEAMQRQIDDLKNENVGLKDRETAVVIIFSVISALLLAALIIVSVNYKKDIR